MTKDPYAGYSQQRTGAERRIAEARYRRDVNQVVEVDDPRLNAAQKELGLRLADFRERNPHINRDTARELEDIVRTFRDRAKNAGIKMPRMKVVYFVRMNHVCIWPEELEHKDLQRRLTTFITHRQRHGKTVDADDIAMGVRRAYPDYSPSRTTLILPPTVTNQQETAQ